MFPVRDTVLYPIEFNSHIVKDYELEYLHFSRNSLLMSSYKSCVVSLGVTLRMAVELDSNSNIIIEIISKTKCVIN